MNKFIEFFIGPKDSIFSYRTIKYKKFGVVFSFATRTSGTGRHFKVAYMSWRKGVYLRFYKKALMVYLYE